MEKLGANHRYLLRWAEAAGSEAIVLDYGCGGGEVVAAGRERGLQIYGAEVFYEGGNTRTRIEELGLLGDAVREITDGRLAFPSDHFDLVTANQVFEHIAHLEPVLDEIHRVLKPGGRLLALFPSLGVLREGHIGIPAAHWFRPGRMRTGYTLVLRRLGLGYNRDERSVEQWTREQLVWLDRFTFYRTKRAALRPFHRRFSVQLIEDDYAAFRLAASAMRMLLRVPGSRPIVRFTVRRLAGMVVLAHKETNSVPGRQEHV